MRDLAFALVILSIIPAMVARPINVYLLWGWTGMLAPSAYFFGFMADVRINFIFAALTIALLLLGRVKWSEYQNNRVSWWLVVLMIHASFVCAFAYPGNPFNLQYYELLMKGLIFALLMPLFIREKVHFHAMFIVVVLGLGIHGVLNGLKTIASGGGHNMSGPVGTMLFDRNHLSVALTMIIPFLYYLQIYLANRWMRILALGGMCVVVLAIFGGGSRGGFISLSVVALWLIMISSRKVLAITLVVMAGTLFIVFAPEAWMARLSTLQEVDEDASFMGRVIAWKISSAIALQNPLFGGGFHAVQVQYIWDMFKASPGLLSFLDLPVPEFAAKAAHSVYFELLGDSGFVGLGIFTCIILTAFVARKSIIRETKDKGPKYKWAQDMADMLFLSLLAFLTGGASVSLSYFEVVYMIAMMLELLRLYVARQEHQYRSAY